MRNHELFPGTEDKPQGPEVVKILVTRQENGTMMQSPYGYVLAEELPDVATLYAKYGGGVYELVARNEKNITARVSLRLPGDSKPLGPPSAAAPFQMPAAAPAQSSGGGVSPGWIAALAALTPVLLGFFQMQSARADQTMQMMMTVMNAKSSDSQAFVQMMQAASASQQAQMMALFQAIGKTGGAEGAENTLLRGVQLANDLRAGMNDAAGEAAGGDDIVGVLQKVLGMLEKTKQLADTAPNASATDLAALAAEEAVADA